MYDELIKRLREHNGWALNETLDEAANAIEALSAFKAQITDGHFYCMRDGVLYEAKVEPPRGNVIQLPRIEFAEPPKEG